MYCRKPIEQSRPDIDLTRPYCNDPRAINYNDSFPGIPDNSKCHYPDEQFDGNWVLTDSVFRIDSTWVETFEREIYFTPTMDSSRAIIQMHNWCGTPIEMKASRYGKAEVVNKLSYPDSAQIACGTDSIMGYMQFKFNTRDTLIIFLTRHPEAGTKYYHKGIAYKN